MTARDRETLELARDILLEDFETEVALLMSFAAVGRSRQRFATFRLNMIATLLQAIEAQLAAPQAIVNTALTRIGNENTLTSAG